MEWRGGTIKILVTGGAGYIGSVVVDELLKLGHEVSIYDIASPSMKVFSPDVFYTNGDIIDTYMLNSHIAERGIEAVVHMAGLIEVGRSTTNPEEFYLTNAGGMASLLKAIRMTNVERVIFSSTASVYGHTSPATESTPPDPPNTYAESKIMAEYMMSSSAMVRDISFSALRFFNAAGATATRHEAHKPETHLIPKLLQSIKDFATFDVYGIDYPTYDGSAVRDYVHVLDIASAVSLALTFPNGFDTYNVGTGSGYSVWDVIKEAEEVTSSFVMDRALARRPGDQPSSVADSTKLQSLGWKPLHSSMKNILETAWAHY